VKIWSIPNSLTFLRLGLIPVFNYFFLMGEYGLALFFFVVAGFTDFFDGILARVLNARTPLGTFLDPTADKILMAVTFVVLAVAGAIPIWITVLVYAKDIYVVGGMIYLKIRGWPYPIRPSKLSKFNTGSQLLLITLCFLYYYLKIQTQWEWDPDPLLSQLLWITIYFTASMTILTGIQYTRIGWRFYKGKSEDGVISATEDKTGRQ